MNGKLLTVNIVGAGVVGKTFAKLIANSNLAKIGSVKNSTYISSMEAVNFIGQGVPVKDWNDITPSDITFIGVHEELIEEICEKLIKLDKLKPRSILLHFSGILPVSILGAAKEQSCFIARLHPIKHMRLSTLSKESLIDAYCTYDGDKEAYPIIAALVEGIGAKLIKFSFNQLDTKYHAACVFACVYPQMLLSISAKILEECGISKIEALSLSKGLAKQSIENLDIHLDYSEFVEGPIKRNDPKLIRSHLSSLTEEIYKAVYKNLGRFALNLTTHSISIKNKLKKLL